MFHVNVDCRSCWCSISRCHGLLQTRAGRNDCSVSRPIGQWRGNGYCQHQLWYRICNRYIETTFCILCVDCDHTVLDKFVNDCCEHYENMPVHEVMNSVWHDTFYDFFIHFYSYITTFYQKLFVTIKNMWH